MLDLGDAIPRDTILARYPEAVERVIVRGVDQLRVDRIDDIPAVALFVWDEMVHRGVADDPSAMADIYPDRSDEIFDFVAGVLGAPPIVDAFAAEWFNRHSEETPFVKIDLYQCYPNDLHVADIVFADLERPVVDNSEFGPRQHRGLGLFSEFFERLKDIARQRGIARISLVAGSRAAHTLFSKHGFRVSDSPVGQKAFAMLGCSHPMIFDL